MKVVFPFPPLTDHVGLLGELHAVTVSVFTASWWLSNPPIIYSGRVTFAFFFCTSAGRCLRRWQSKPGKESREHKSFCSCLQPGACHKPRMARYGSRSAGPALRPGWLPRRHIWPRGSGPVPVLLGSRSTGPIPSTSLGTWWFPPWSWDSRAVPTRGARAVPFQSRSPRPVPWAVPPWRSSRTATRRPRLIPDWTISLWARSTSWAVFTRAFPRWPARRRKRNVWTRRPRWIPSSSWPQLFPCLSCRGLPPDTAWILGCWRWRFPTCPRPVWSLSWAYGSIWWAGCSRRHVGE